MVDKIRSILDLSLSLAKVNFKLRNEGTYLGMLWYLLEPILMFLLLLYIFSPRMTTVKNYPLYLLLGLIMYNLFSGATINSTRAIVDNASFIKSLKIPYEPLVLSIVLQFIFTHIFEIVVLAIFMIYFHVSLMGLIFYPMLLFFYAVFICGISFALAAIGVRINDIGNVWRVLITLMWFATPIFYSIKESSIQFLLNPIARFIAVARDLIIANSFPSIGLIVQVIAISFFSLAVGLGLFSLLKNRFVEYV